MNTTIYLLGGMAIVSIMLIIYAFWPKPTKDDDAIKRRMIGRRGQNAMQELRRQAKESVAKKVMDAVAPIAIRSSMKNDVAQMSKLRMKLAMAGLRSESAPTTFLASKTVMAVLLGLAAATFVWAKGTTLQNAVGSESVV